jgi:hypothetical protein
MAPRIVIKAADAVSFPCDILILKYARALYGLDRAVVNLLAEDVGRIGNSLPDIGDCAVFDTNGKLPAKQVIFIGTNGIWDFNYNDIRIFAKKALEFCAVKADRAKTIAITLHGVGFGLDEREALYSEIIGLYEAILLSNIPKHLEFIYILERDEGRAHRLSEALQEMAHPLSDVPLISESLAENQYNKQISGSVISFNESKLTYTTRPPGEKPSIFVAMPFLKEMDDIFYYGIQRPIEQAGCLCERADIAAFTGDVMDWVRKKIGSSRLVVADLTGANPRACLQSLNP